MGQAHVHTRKLNRNILTGTAVFLNQKRTNVCEHTTRMVSLERFLSQPHGGTFYKVPSDAIFVVCSQTFVFFWLRKKAVPVEIFQLSFNVCTCAYPTVTSSIFGKSFHFPFPYFMLMMSFIIPIQKE